MSHESAANALAHLAHADPGDPLARTKLLQQLRGAKTGIVLVKPLADSAAGDLTPAYGSAAADEMSDATYFPYAYTVTSVKVMPLAVLTASDTVFATITVVYDDGNNGADTAIAALATNVASGNWVAGTAKTATLTGGLPVNIPAGSWVTFAITKASTGTVVPACRIVLDGMLT